MSECVISGGISGLTAAVRNLQIPDFEVNKLGGGYRVCDAPIFKIWRSGISYYYKILFLDIRYGKTRNMSYE